MSCRFRRPGLDPIMSFHGENTILPMGGIKGPYLGEDPCHLYNKRKWGIRWIK